MATWRGLVTRGLACLICLVCFTLVALAVGFSAMWTAPPASSTVPAAVADSFARAILTDMRLSFRFLVEDFRRRTRWNMPLSLEETAPARNGQSN